MNKQYRVVMHRAPDKGGGIFRQLIDPLEAEVAPCVRLVKSCYSPNWMLTRPRTALSAGKTARGPDRTRGGIRTSARARRSDPLRAPAPKLYSFQAPEADASSNGKAARAGDAANVSHNFRCNLAWLKEFSYCSQIGRRLTCQNPLKRAS
jgi:hypothetical protein